MSRSTLFQFQYSIFALCLLFCVLAAPSVFAKSYYAQIKAAETISEIESEQTRLAPLHLPSVITRTEVNAQTYYRLRLGPFKAKDDAKAVAEFIGYNDTWIVASPETPKFEAAKSFQPTYSDLIRAQLLLSENRPLVVVYERGRDMGGPSIRGTSATFITPYSIKSVQNVTGIKDDENNIVVGILTEVYRDPEGYPPDQFSEEIRLFSQQHALSTDTVKQHLKRFGDSHSVGFTLRKNIDIQGGITPASMPSGFDYWGSSGEIIQSGTLSLNTQLGSEDLKNIDDGWSSIQSELVTVLSFAEVMEPVRILVLFKHKKEL